jgi:hypothetical protein
LPGFSADPGSLRLLFGSASGATATATSSISILVAEAASLALGAQLAAQWE